MKPSLRAIAVVLSVLAGGCTTIDDRPVGDALGAQLAGQAVAVVARNTSRFGVGAAGKFAALGPFAIEAGIERGQQLVRSAHIVDPADAIAAQLGDALAQQRGVVVLAPRIRGGPDDAPATIVAAVPPRARYVLDVATVGWGITNLPEPKAGFYVSYFARARLIDARTRAVVAEGGCQVMPDATAFHGPYAELVADDAALAKTELAARAGQCVRHMSLYMLGR